MCFNSINNPVDTSCGVQSEGEILNVEGRQFLRKLSQVGSSHKNSFVCFDWVASLELGVHHLTQRLSLFSSFKGNEAQFTALFYRLLLLVWEQVAIRYHLSLLCTALLHVLGEHFFHLRALFIAEFQRLFLFYSLACFLYGCKILVLD